MYRYAVRINHTTAASYTLPLNGFRTSTNVRTTQEGVKNSPPCFPSQMHSIINAPQRVASILQNHPSFLPFLSAIIAYWVTPVMKNATYTLLISNKVHYTYTHSSHEDEIGGISHLDAFNVKVPSNISSRLLKEHLCTIFKNLFLKFHVTKLFLRVYGRYHLLLCASPVLCSPGVVI